MRVAALVLGILGGLFGFAGSFFALFAGSVAGTFGMENADTVFYLGLLAIPFSILGVIGGALALSKPKAAGWSMLISAVGGVIAISAGFAIAGIMLFVGAIFAFVGSKKPKASLPQAHDSTS